jgi:hypothetical protein
MLISIVAANVLWSRRSVDEAPAPMLEMDDRLSSLERSIDAVAIEVERVGEGQRYMTQRLAQDAPVESAATARGDADAPR